MNWIGTKKQPGGSGRFFVILLLAAAVMPSGCGSFRHLTEISNLGPQPGGPTAQECGACHVDQYREWLADPHSRAAVNPAFQRALGQGGDDSCLGCHAPLTVWASGELVGRRFNTHEGVTCIACHFRSGGMAGPHGRSALFAPHPVFSDDTFRQSALCGVCHREVFGSWEKSSAVRTETPSCQQCHMPAIVRKTTRGTNFFSRLLVLFEDEVVGRGHRVELDNRSSGQQAVLLELVDVTGHGDGLVFRFSLRNSLPHLLPALTYGSGVLSLSVSLESSDGRLLTETEVALDEEGNAALPPDAIIEKTIAIGQSGGRQLEKLAAKLTARVMLRRTVADRAQTSVAGELRTSLRP